MQNLCRFIYLLIFLGFNPYALALNINELESQAIMHKVTQLNGASRMICTQNIRCSLSLTTSLYQNNAYQPIWSKNGQLNDDANSFIQIIRHSYQDGLNPLDYHTKEIKSLSVQINDMAKLNQADPELLASFDVTLSDAYLLYTKHMQSGKLDPLTTYPNWPISFHKVNILEQMQQALQQDKLISNLRHIGPNFLAYRELKQQLAIYQRIANNGGWPTIPSGADLHSGNKSKRVIILRKRLNLTVAENSSNAQIFDPELKLALAQWQSDNNIRPSGVLNKTTLSALNQPVELIIKKIALNMDRLRYLPANLANEYVWINIPNYSLAIYQNQQLVLSMQVIVGGRGENKSCLINSSITTIEINPYWGIPYRIATKEYLSKIQADPNYLEQHDIRVFDPHTSLEVDPTRIDWANITANNFNYFLRQDPGKKNVLGKLKFLFPNDCGIYLHDTSNPNLFAKQSRGLSHGCIRISQPQELADYLIRSTPTFSSEKLESAIHTGKHKWLKLNQAIAIYITYQTAFVAPTGRLQLRNDIYKADDVDFPIFIPNDKLLNEAYTN